jgi:hypothetical protein
MKIEFSGQPLDSTIHPFELVLNRCRHITLSTADFFVAPGSKANQQDNQLRPNSGTSNLSALEGLPV